MSLRYFELDRLDVSRNSKQRDCEPREDGRSLRSRCDFPVQIPPNTILTTHRVRAHTTRCSLDFIRRRSGVGGIFTRLRDSLRSSRAVQIHLFTQQSLAICERQRKWGRRDCEPRGLRFARPLGSNPSDTQFHNARVASTRYAVLAGYRLSRKWGRRDLNPRSTDISGSASELQRVVSAER